jgi:hypothetical protein
MIPPCQDTTHNQECQRCKTVDLQLKKSTTQEQGQEMIVFAQKELQGMDIDGIIVGTAEERGERR